MLYKFSNILVTRQKNDEGLILHHVINNNRLQLNKKQSHLWIQFDDANEVQDKTLLDSLVKNGFIIEMDKHAFHEDTLSFNHIPEIEGPYVKWYEESPELFILFNTEQMTKNNPLLVLNSYGSVIWKLIITKTSIRKIREGLSSVFGIDDVMPFLKKLSGLGFIKDDPVYHDHKKERIDKSVEPSYLQSQIFQAKIPWYCLWEICTVCNNQCEICYLKDFALSGLEHNKILSIIENIAESHIFYVSIMGGEPLLLENLHLIIKELRGYGIYTKIISNGMSLTQKKAKLFSESGLNHMEISFDGLSEITHDLSRGKESFLKAVKAIHNAKQGGIPRVGMVFSLHNRNFHEHKDLPEFMISLGIKECYISLFKKTGLKGGMSQFEAIPEKNIETIRTNIKKWKENFPDLIITLLPYCTCGRTSVVIGADGEIRPCSFSYKSYGNITENTLIEIWNSIHKKLPASGPFGFCNQE
ncbi:MAG: radical SAM protein [Spirochaetales bacterium]|nr:radical SAM protein [Spirochaetales bacterium]